MSRRASTKSKRNSDGKKYRRQADTDSQVNTETESEARRLDESMPTFVEQSDTSNPELDSGRHLTCTSCGQMIQLPDKEKYSVACVCGARYSREVVQVRRRGQEKRAPRSFVGEQIANNGIVFQIVEERPERHLVFGDVVRLTLKPIGRTQ